MLRIDEFERPMPEINPAKVCFIIEKSREYFLRRLIRLPAPAPLPMSSQSAVVPFPIARLISGRMRLPRVRFANE
jgi:hypothetical protein